MEIQGLEEECGRGLGAQVRVPACTTIADRQEEASRQWGIWLESTDWDLRLVVTFAPKKFRRVSSEFALTRVRDGMNWLGGYLRRSIAWLAFTEFTTTGLVHAHVLVRFTDNRRPGSKVMLKWHRWWRRRNGFVRIQRFVNGLGGATYDSKHAGSSETQWECSNALVELLKGRN